MQEGSFWPLLAKTMSSRYIQVLTLSPIFFKNATSTDLEHEDSVGGFIDGGSLAEGHREELGGG